MRENAKDMGLDQYEVRSFMGWYRHVTLVIVAAAYLSGICAQARACSPTTCLSMPALLPLTVPEVRHLLARLVFPSPCSVRRVLGCRVVATCASGPGQLLPYPTSQAQTGLISGSVRDLSSLFFPREEHPYATLFPGNSLGKYAVSCPHLLERSPFSWL
jgi:hypothetical protein